MKKIIVAILFLVFIVGISNGQSRLTGERGIYSQAHLNPVLVNPGATGFGAQQELLFNYRNTWAGFPGTPRTMTFAYNGPMGNRLGFGAQVISDKFAAFETTKGMLALSYSIESPTNKVGFGLSTEYVQHRLSGENFDSELVDRNDQEILSRLDGSQFFDASFGIYGLYDNRLLYGIAFPSLISSKLNEVGNSSSPDKELSYIINLGYRLQVENYDMVIEPSMFIKQLMLTPLHVDMNLKMDFLDEKLTGGISYTLGADERFGFLLGAKVNNFGFYYTYNMSFHDFQQYNNGSHEFSLKLNITRRDQR